MENNLPKGWAEIELKKIISYRKGKKPKKLSKKEFENCVPYLNIKAVEKSIIDEFADKTSSKISIGDEIFVVWDGARSGWVAKGMKGAIGSTLMALKPYILNDDYLFYFLKTQFDTINSKPRGTGIPHVDPEIFWNIKVPLAPLAEENRIVAKLDAVLARVANCKSRLEKIPVLLKNFRQSVLATAVSGELTKKWAENQKLTDEWKEVELENLVGKGGVFDGPFGSNLKTSDYTDRGVRVVRLENIEHLYFVEEKQTFISEEKYQTLLKHGVIEGDLIFSSFIADEIRVCMLPKLETLAIAKADCFCIRPLEKLVVKKFLLLVLASRYSYEQLVSNIHGATRPRINTTQLKKILLLMPSLEEQKEIVRIVEELFHFADNIEARYQKAKAWFDKIPQAILAKAFRGELVEQDENDEHASVLLERIKKVKQNTNKPKPTAKRKKVYEENEGVSLAAED